MGTNKMTVTLFLLNANIHPHERKLEILDFSHNALIRGNSAASFSTSEAMTKRHANVTSTALVSSELGLARWVVRWSLTSPGRRRDLYGVYELSG